MCLLLLRPYKVLFLLIKLLLYHRLLIFKLLLLPYLLLHLLGLLQLALLHLDLLVLDVIKQLLALFVVRALVVPQVALVVRLVFKLLFVLFVVFGFEGGYLLSFLLGVCDFLEGAVFFGLEHAHSVAKQFYVFLYLQTDFLRLIVS